MKKIFAMALVFLFTLSCAYAVEPSLSQFTCEDAKGDLQTEAIFAGHDLTVINIWSPWCLACASDVPKFINLVNQLPENVNLITICDMNEEEYDIVYSIVTEANANYITLLANDEIRKELLFDFQMLPVTIFVNSEGELVGEPLYNAAEQENMIQKYLEVIDERLELLEV